MTKRIKRRFDRGKGRIIDSTVKPRERTHFIQRAVLHYVTTASPGALQEQLKQAALRDRDLDLEIANDWFAVDQEQWQRLGSLGHERPSRHRP